MLQLIAHFATMLLLLSTLSYSATYVLFALAIDLGEWWSTYVVCFTFAWLFIDNWSMSAEIYSLNHSITTQALKHHSELHKKKGEAEALCVSEQARHFALTERVSQLESRCALLLLEHDKRRQDSIDHEDEEERTASSIDVATLACLHWGMLAHKARTLHFFAAISHLSKRSRSQKKEIKHKLNRLRRGTSVNLPLG